MTALGFSLLVLKQVKIQKSFLEYIQYGQITLNYWITLSIWDENNGSEVFGD